ncbi:MAG: radical SAM protein [Treponema sp.]
MADFYSACRQCPRDCGTDRNCKTGFCGELKDIRIASACLHFGEEPLITVFGGSGTIFFTGCTLGCSFCQNYQISQQGTGRKVSKDEFVRICLELQKAGAENINLVTASHLIPLLAEYLAEAKNAGVKIPFCWNSSAYEKVESLELLKDLVTIWLPDLKTLNGEVSSQLFKAQDYPKIAKDAVLWMIKNNPLKIQSVTGIDRETKEKVTKEKMTGGVIIRHLFLPGRFEDTADVLEWLKNNADKKAVISLMSQYTPVPFKEAEEKLEKRMSSLSLIENRLVSAQEDFDLKDLIDAFDFDFLFYQDLTDDTEWLPDFNRVQPFSNALAKPVWHWKNSFDVF